MNRRNFLKTALASVIGTFFLPSLAILNTVGNKSKFIFNEDRIVIFPSEYLIQKYNLCRTARRSFVTIENDSAMTKRQMTPFGGVQELNTPLDKSLYCNEKFVESMIKYAKEKMEAKTICTVIITRALCVQNNYNSIRIMVRHSRKEAEKQFV